MQAEKVETVIVGGGQAGLTLSHMLSKRDRPHVVLERARIAERWRSERWDGLRFQFPNWSVQLPDFPFPHADPEGFATSEEIVDFLTAYADFIAAPVRCGVTVTALRRRDGGADFYLETSDGPIRASNVVVATGPYQIPIIPALLPEDAGLYQVHASRYREPGQLPDGAVLVVGSGASGAQIAEELMRAGRRVYLSVGRHRRLPRRYRSRDLIWWLAAMGLDRTPIEKRGPDKTLPLITGAYGGHTIDFRTFAAEGAVLLGRLELMSGRTLHFAPDLANSLRSGDAAYTAFLDLVDSFVGRQGLDVPEEPGARTMRADPACVMDPVRTLDIDAASIGSVIWSTGYGCDFGWIDLPVLDGRGEPVHRDGITDVPGLYFLGLQWLSRMNSSFLVGVAEDAARLADHIAARSPGMS
ncbi:NAD(P)-binding domain-containing protein [Reyranella sp.]|uniref:NAD(P)-binding domain-containing protein n=1 Tax=Reyranella sp. TaxID=1929291 RepID=UPI003D0C67A0